MKALPLLLAVLCAGAAVAAIDTLARDRNVLSPSAGLAASTGELGSLGTATEWLNSPPLTEAGLRGKVVLVEFWTYTCITDVDAQGYGTLDQQRMYQLIRQQRPKRRGLHQVRSGETHG